ncbi:MAG: C10 family peptidase [Bacteroidetes bacterium]|nr:C10 family peptidase [Bacteroidota bacterium]
MKAKSYFVLIIVLFLGISFSASAKLVNIKDARLAGKNFYYERINQYNNVPYQSLEITSEFIEKAGNIPAYYVFNFNDRGFIIITADDAMLPVIGYSFESSYSHANQAPEFTNWMNQRKEEIAYNLQHNIQADETITSTWERLFTADQTKLMDLKGSRDVAPLLVSNWDQNFPYNAMCPADAAGPGGHVYVGCVATSMAQIMYYWRWPNTGSGYHCDSHQNYGVLCADFANSTYDWTGMVDEPGQQCDPVALISYHAGISVNMQYGNGVPPNDGSGAYESDIPYALKTYFKYASSCTYYQKSGYTGWDNLLQGDLDAGQPVGYSGSGSGGGHSWVCDGYQGTTYHMNWGWSGQDNGYFSLTNLNPSGYNFNSSQGAVVHIQPDQSSYPTYCSGQTTLSTYDFGTIDDGSGPISDYQNNSNCSWLIAPADSISHITLTFEKFSTDPADIVNVYDGNSASAPLLGSFNGTNLPTIINSTGGQMFITFTSNSSTTATGFFANYNAIPVAFCSGETDLFDPMGDISDGSGTFQYRNGVNCKWLIEPWGAQNITLTFDDFKTEQDNDKVTIYDYITSSILATYSGEYTTPPAPVYCPHNQMYIIFSTNGSIRNNGWHASYSITSDGTDDNKGFNNLTIYPNPTNGLVNIEFTLNQSQTVKAELVSLTGETVYTESFGNVKGTFSKQMDFSSIAKGVYMLKLSSNKVITNKKIVID